MFNNFQEALISAGHMLVMSAAEFVRGVKEFGEAQWKINVFPAGTAEGEDAILRGMMSRCFLRVKPFYIEHQGQFRAWGYQT